MVLRFKVGDLLDGRKGDFKMIVWIRILLDYGINEK